MRKPASEEKDIGVDTITGENESPDLVIDEEDLTGDSELDNPLELDEETKMLLDAIVEQRLRNR